MGNLARALTDVVGNARLSTTACSLLLNGTTTIDNTIPTKGGLTHLYTGTGASNPLDLGVGFIDFTVASNGSGYYLDRTTNEFKNDAGVVQDLTTPIVLALEANKYVGKFEIKGRSINVWHVDFDCLRGANQGISSNVSNAEILYTENLNSFDATGITVGTNVNVNELNTTYVLHAEVYTHIKASLVNGNLQVVAWNPITKMGMAYRLGSNSVANADRPFKVDYQETKRLNSADDGVVYYGDKDRFLNIYATTGSASAPTASDLWEVTSDSFGFIANNQQLNQSGGVYVDYFFGNSEYKKLVNYTGTGVAGNEVEVGFMPSRVILKRLDATGNHLLIDNQRTNFDAFLYLSASDIEISFDVVDIAPTKLIISSTGSQQNASGGQYIAIVEADTNKNNGGIIFPFVTDDNNLLVTDGGYIHTDGKTIDGSFNKTSEVVSGVQSFDLTGVSDGKKYLAREYGTGTLKAYDGYSVGLYDKESADDNRLVFDVDSGKHYDTVGGELFADSFIVTSGSYSNSVLFLDGITSQSHTAKTSFNTVVGEVIKVSFNAILTSNDFDVFIGTTDGGTDILNGVGVLDNSGYTEYTFAAQSTTTYFEFGCVNDRNATITNFTVYKKQATLGTPLTTPISFISRYPYMVVSETPQYEMVDEKAISVNVMDSLEANEITAKTLNVTNGFDLNQKWVDVTSERVLNVVYTNTTGKPIEINIMSRNSVGYENIHIEVNGTVNMLRSGESHTSNYNAGITFIIPNNASYRVTTHGGANSIVSVWSELR